MKIVGLTGGIGSGKSTVAKMFGRLGIPVYDSDYEAKLLMAQDPEIKKAVQKLLGKESYGDAGPNRPYIAQKVFADKMLLKALNGIIHPAVHRHFIHWAQQQKSPYVVQESALIFENGSQDRYDKIILVTAPKEIRIQRAMDRDGVAREKILQRMDNQMDEMHKISKSDYLVHNVELMDTENAIALIHKDLMAVFG